MTKNSVSSHLSGQRPFFRLPNGDTLNLLLDSWAILAITVNEEDMGVRAIKHLSAICFCRHIISYFAVSGQTFNPIRFYLPILLGLFASHNHVEPLLADVEGQYFLLHLYTSSQSVARISSKEKKCQ